MIQYCYKTYAVGIWVSDYNAYLLFIKAIPIVFNLGNIVMLKKVWEENKVILPL